MSTSLPYVKGSSTSKAAANVAVGSSLHDEAKVFAYLRDISPSTDEEVSAALGNLSARSRRIGLMHKGWVRDSGKQRPTYRGCAATVWEVVPENEREAQIGKVAQTAALKAVRKRVRDALKGLDIPSCDAVLSFIATLQKPEPPPPPAKDEESYGYLPAGEEINILTLFGQ